MDIELRWVEHKGPWNSSAIRVLQYRMKNSAGLRVGGVLVEWTDWMDVPVVQNQVITPEESQEAPGKPEKTEVSQEEIDDEIIEMCRREEQAIRGFIARLQRLIRARKKAN